MHPRSHDVHHFEVADLAHSQTSSKGGHQQRSISLFCSGFLRFALHKLYLMQVPAVQYDHSETWPPPPSTLGQKGQALLRVCVFFHGRVSHEVNNFVIGLGDPAVLTNCFNQRRFLTKTKITVQTKLSRLPPEEALAVIQIICHWPPGKPGNSPVSRSTLSTPRTSGQ